MSQSPVDDLSEQATLSYKQGWRALNRLLHEDRSFSGHERNCAFLNTGGGSARFADVSAVSGFDFPDDARGLATADWDWDGDLDVWITNRTAPRVRLLKNNTPASGRFVAFKLEGDGESCNRDAIGARLELHPSGTGQPVRIRTLRCGEGFLSQSSNWVHFGLGEQTGIDKLLVRWPGGPEQEFTGIEPGRFYRLKQSQAAPVPFLPPAGLAGLRAADQVAQPLVESARTIVPPGLPLPDIMLTGADGRDTALELSTVNPTLINLWSSTCASCLHEQGERSADADRLSAAGLEIITLNTDSLTGKTDPAQSLAALAKAGSTFPNRSISAGGVQSLDDLQRAILDRWIPLPVPASFLVDASGELVAMYKGPVSTKQLLADLALADASPVRRRESATPFQGQWVGPPASAKPQRVSSIMLDHNRLGAARDYVAKCLKHFEEFTTSGKPHEKRQLGDLYYLASLLTSSDPTSSERRLSYLENARDLLPHDLRIRLELGKQFASLGRPDEALAEFSAASEINPSDMSLRHRIGLIHFQRGNYADARSCFASIVAEDQTDGVARYNLANSDARLNRFPEAIDGYRRTLAIEPGILDAANNLAWILASHPDEKLRADQEALALVQRLCSITKNQNPRFLDTLSVALANSGDFNGAIDAADQAIALYGDQNPTATAQLDSRRRLYSDAKPYRENQWR